MGKDSMDLPERRLPVVQNNDLEKFTEKQRDVIISTKADLAKSKAEMVNRAAQDFGIIAKDAIAIWKIREQSQADVTRIKAEEDKIVNEIREQIEKLKQENANILTRGEITMTIIKEVNQMMLSQEDRTLRQGLIDALPRLVEAALVDRK